MGLLLFFFMVSSSFADQQGGQRPAAYLDYGGGGSQNAMAGAAVAVRGDPACGFWNPAGLSALRGFQGEIQDSLLSSGQKLYFLSLAKGFRDQFFLAFSCFYYTAGDDLEERRGPSLEPDALFNDEEYSFFWSLGVRLSSRWSVGLSLKLLFQGIGPYTGASGTGFGEDLGVQYRFTQKTTFGFMAQNPYTLFSYGASDQILPVTLKAGISQEEEELDSKLNFDLEWSADLGFRPRLGLEWKPLEALALRGGVWAGNLTAGAPGGALLLHPSLGLGLTLPLGESRMELGYGLLPDRIDNGSFQHQISLTAKFL